MRTGTMNKLAESPKCPHCESGKIRVPRVFGNTKIASAPSAGPGFVLVDCDACNGSGRR